MILWLVREYDDYVSSMIITHTNNNRHIMSGEYIVVVDLFDGEEHSKYK